MSSENFFKRQETMRKSEQGHVHGNLNNFSLIRRILVRLFLAETTEHVPCDDAIIPESDYATQS